MHFLVLCVCLLLAASPSKTDPVSEVIRRTAKTTLVRIKDLRHLWSVAPGAEPSPSVEGLTRNCHYLGLLEDKLHSIERFSQIQKEIQDIRGWVCNYTSALNCPVWERPSGTMAPLRFPWTEGFRTLDEVESYLTEIVSSTGNRLTVC